MREDLLITEDATEGIFFVRLCKSIRVLVGILADVQQPVLRWTSITVHIFLQSCALLITVAMVLGTNSLYEFFERLGNFASFLTVFAMRSYYFAREKRVLLLSYQLGEKWAGYHRSIRHSEGIKILRNCEIVMKVIFYSLASGSFCAFLAYSAFPIVRFYVKPDSKENHVALPLKIYFPFEDSPVLRSSVYIIICACIAYYCLLLAVISAVFLCLFCVLEAAFKLNGMFFERFHGGKTDQDKLEIIRRWNVAKHVIVIDEHQKLYRMAEEVRFLMREILFFMYAGATTAVSFSAVLISADPHRYGASATIVCVPIMHTFFFFFMASRVATACEETATIIYSQHIELLKRGSEMDAKILLFLLMRAQKPVIFEAGRFCKLTLENYVSFMQNIYSLTMLLSSVRRKV